MVFVLSTLLASFAPFTRLASAQTPAAPTTAQLNAALDSHRAIHRFYNNIHAAGGRYDSITPVRPELVEGSDAQKVSGPNTVRLLSVRPEPVEGPHV